MIISRLGSWDLQLLSVVTVLGELTALFRVYDSLWKTSLIYSGFDQLGRFIIVGSVAYIGQPGSRNQFSLAIMLNFLEWQGFSVITDSHIKYCCWMGFTGDIFVSAAIQLRYLEFSILRVQYPSPPPPSPSYPSQCVHLHIWRHRKSILVMWWTCLEENVLVCLIK